MSILVWIVFGLVVGAAAKFIMPGDDPGGIFITIVIGIVGAIIGGFIGSMFGWGDVEGFDIRSLFLAIGGALLLLAAYRQIKKKK